MLSLVLLEPPNKVAVWGSVGPANVVTLLAEKFVTYRLPELSNALPVLNPDTPVFNVPTNTPAALYSCTIPWLTEAKTSPAVNVAACAAPTAIVADKPTTPRTAQNFFMKLPPLLKTLDAFLFSERGPPSDFVFTYRKP